jgi:hypothetical protein
MEEKQFLLCAEIAMVSLLGLLLELLPLFELSFVREGDSIDSLERIVCHLSEPIGGRGLD